MTDKSDVLSALLSEQLVDTDLSIAMALGTEVVVCALAMTLMLSQSVLVCVALQTARRSDRKIQQNLFWAFIFNVKGVPRCC